MKQQFVELLSDIGFVKEGIVAKDVERAARSGGDGIASITGEEVRQGALAIRCTFALVDMITHNIFGPQCKKTCLQSFQLSRTQSSLLS